MEEATRKRNHAPDGAAVSLAEMPDTLTVQEASAVLRLSRNSVYEGIRRNEIPAVRLGRRFRIPRAGIERLLKIAGAG